MSIVKLAPEDFISESPRFPDVPFAEYKSRIDRAKQLMSENEIDCLLLWHRQNIRYFLGYVTTHWECLTPYPCVGIIPLDHDPVLVPADLSLVNAQIYSWVRDIWYVPKAHEYQQQRELSRDIAKLIKDMGYGSKNIGLEMGPKTPGSLYIPRPYDDIQNMIAELPDAKWVAGEDVIWGCRKIKSPLEIERLRKAATITMNCYGAVAEQFRPGMTELDVAKIVQHAAVDGDGLCMSGDTNYCSHVVCTNEKEGVCNVMADYDAPITRNDYIMLDLDIPHKGYFADHARTFQVGPVTDAVKTQFELVKECMLRGEEMLKAGVVPSELYKHTVAPLLNAGFKPLELVGHGIGMDIHDPPDLDAETHEPLEEGMVVAMEVWTIKEDSFRRNGGPGIYALEDMYVITANGWEKLPSFPWDIIQVAHPFD